MKKMMMMVAALLMAVGVNAAVVNWQSGSMLDLPAYVADWQGQTMYFFLVDSIGYDLSGVITSLSNGGALNTGGADASNVLGPAPFYNTAKLGSDNSFVGGDVAYGYAVVYNDVGASFAISAVMQSAVFPASGNASLALGGASNFDVYTVVPEPTSFALLALGAAAVGLRRRLKK